MWKTFATWEVWPAITADAAKDQNAVNKENSLFGRLDNA